MRVDCWSRRPWAGYLLLGTALAGAVQLLAPSAGWAWAALQLAGVAATGVTLPRIPAAARPGWWLLTAARTAGVLSTAWWTVHLARGGPAPTATMVGLSTAPLYGLFALAGVRLLGRRRRSGGAESGFEVAAVLVALAMLAWCFVVQPYLEEPGYRQVDSAMAVLYALFDVAILGGALRSPFTTPRGPARLFGAAGATLLSSHLLYAALAAAGPAQFLPGGFAFFLVQLSGVLLTAAAAHPDAGRLGDAPATASSAATPVSGTKVLLILLTAVVSPLLPVAVSLGRGDGASPGVLVPAVLVSALCGLLIGRIWLLVRIGRRLQEQLAYRAGHDSLTRLANRDHFAERLAEAGPSAVLLCGLDGFKAINDSYGHAIGDEVLVRFAARLRTGLREGDLPARLGGDEFGVLVAGDVAEAAALGARLLQVAAEPVLVGDRRIHLGLSVGVAGGVALGDADLALRAAKLEGGNRVATYHPDLRAERLRRAEITDGLRRALTDGSLHMLYQPVVDTQTSATVAVEALMRWDGPDGPVPPATFIPVAEQSGLITTLGAFALRVACEQARRWHESHGLYVTVNVSSHQLQDPLFVDTVLDALARTGLPPIALVLEITESVLVHDDSAVRALHELRGHGIRVAIDDFGTGYSSLAYLHRLPADILKIDRSFISRHTDRPDWRHVGFTRAILEIARTQGLTAVAEGVETSVQADLLRELDCPLSQGYYYSRPATAEAIDTLLIERAPVK